MIRQRLIPHCYELSLELNDIQERLMQEGGWSLERALARPNDKNSDTEEKTVQFSQLVRPTSCYEQATVKSRPQTLD